jgi:hypothetical protein
MGKSTPRMQIAVTIIIDDLEAEITSKLFEVNTKHEKSEDLDLRTYKKYFQILCASFRGIRIL